jgi:Cys-tRNA(Pro)/Cys-tRNA(Cys) deacylase
MNKTNAMRQLDAARIKYTPCEYEVDENDLSGTHIADCIGLPYERVFKTIVLRSDKGALLVFCIPCHKEIDLKRAAAVTGNKRVEPVPVKELLGLTGYIRGGCSPVGTKKPYPVCIHESAKNFEKIYVSAGQRGLQFVIAPEDLARAVDAVFADIVMG